MFNHSQVTAQSLGFEWPNGQILFSKLSFSLSSRRYALVGPNGVGKSTLAKILAGSIAPTSGEVLRDAPCFYLPQFEAPSEQSVGEYLLPLWDSSDSQPHLWGPLLESISIEQNLSKLSGGEWMRVRLSLAVAQPKGLFILDEPTNNLDKETQQLIIDFILSYKNPLLLISHDRKLLNIVDSIYELSNQGINFYGGNFDFFEAQKALERQLQAEQLERAKLEKRKAKKEFHLKLKAQEKRQRKGKSDAKKGGIPKVFANTHKNWAENTTAKIHINEEKRLGAAEQNVARLYQSLKHESLLRLNLPDTSVPNKKLVVELVGANLNLTARTPLWQTPVDFSLRGNSRKAIGGINGSGKTSLIKSLINPSECDFLRVGKWYKADIHTAYLDQTYSQLDFEKTVLENVLDVSVLGKTEVLNRLAAFQLKADKAHQSVQSLSGGEKLKAALAKIFLSEPSPQFLILDEPTNNLDLSSIEVLQQALNAFKGPLLIISHDEQFLESIGIEESLVLHKGSKTCQG